MKQQRTDWFFEARWGVFMFFLGPVVEARGNEFSADEWNQLVDGFDVEGLARQLQEVQAPYFIITLGQNSGHYCAPNATYDRLTGITPSKCSRRDLVADLYTALAPHGIRLLVYIPSGAPRDDPVACEKLEWAFRGSDRFTNFQRKWEAVIHEWSLRWGQKVCGWWVDGCYWIDDMYRHPAPPNFKSFAAAMRAGNSDSIVAWNPGVLYPPINVDKEEDYTAGEINEPEQVDSPGRWVKQAQFHILSYLGQTWAKGPIRFSDAQAIENTRSLTDCGGVVSWDVVPLQDGLIAAPFFRQLKAISAAIAASRALPIMLPPRRLRLTVTFPVAPIVGGTQETMRLTLTNPWDSAVSGQVQIDAEPAGAVKFSRGNVSVCLPAEGHASADIQVAVGANVHADTAITVLLRREGDRRVLRRRLPVHRELLLPVVPPLQGLGDVAARLAAVPVQTVKRDGQSLGNFKLAVAGDRLALSARINDRNIKQTLVGWEGSCVEIYLAPIESQAIRQFILVPATPQAVDRALQNVALQNVACDQAAAIQPAPEVQMETESDEAGYDLRALIPLPWALKQTAVPPRFLLELAVHARLQPGADFCYGNLCASQAATSSTAFYALARLA